MVELQINRGQAILTMASGKVNAMNLELVAELNRVLDDLSGDSRVEGLVLAGNQRVFSAGVDLKRLIAEKPEYLDRFLPQLCTLFVRALQFPKPLVMAITGHAIAGGCVLACTGDYRIISEEARIGVPELRVGVPFPSAGLEIMRWAATPSTFRKMINTGATFVGEHAVMAGLADQACASGEIMDHADRALQEMRQVTPSVFELTKRQIRHPVMKAIESGDDEFGSEIQDLWRHAETRQTVMAWVTNRLSGEDRHSAPS